MHYSDFINVSYDAVSYWKMPEGLITNLPVEKQLEMFYSSVCVDANQACVNYFGVKKKEDFIGKRYNEIAGKTDFTELLKEFIKNGYKLTDYQEQQKISDDVEYIGIDNWYGIVENDEVVSLWIISKDISALKTAEKALRESEERYRALFEYAPVGFTLTSTEGSMHAANKAICDLFGYTPENIMKISAVDLYADNIERKMHIETLEKSGFTYRREIRCIKADGSLFPALISSRILHEIRSDLFKLRKPHAQHVVMC